MSFALAAETCGLDSLLIDFGWSKPDPILLATALGERGIELHPAPYATFKGRTYSATISPESAEIMAKLGTGVLIVPQKPWHLVQEETEVYRRTYREAVRMRVDTDLSNEKINAKVRDHSVQRVPAIAVVGRREAEQRSVALRRLGGEAQEMLPLDEAVRRLAAEATPPDLTRAEQA